MIWYSYIAISFILDKSKSFQILERLFTKSDNFFLLIYNKSWLKWGDQIIEYIWKIVCWTSIIIIEMSILSYL
jgi:hypothetical protein